MTQYRYIEGGKTHQGLKTLWQLRGMCSTLFLRTFPLLLSAPIARWSHGEIPVRGVTADECNSSCGHSAMQNTTWRIIPVSKYLVTPIYKPFRPFGRGPTTPVRGRNLTMVFNHVSKSWEDPPSNSRILYPFGSQIYTVVESGSMAQSHSQKVAIANRSFPGGNIPSC